MFVLTFLAFLVISTSASIPLYERVVKANLDPEQQRLYNNGARLRAVVSHTLIQFDASTLVSAKEVSADIEDVGQLTFENRRTEIRPDNSFSWFGHQSSEPSTVNLIFTVSADGKDMFATIRAYKSFYSIRAIGNGYAILIEFDDQAFPDEEEPLMIKGEDEINTIISSSTGRKSTKATTYRIILAYTPAAANEVGNIITHLQLAVDETNEGYIQSDVALTVEVTRVYQTNYTESASYSTDLSRFRTKNDGYMDEVHTYRASDRANIAHLIVEEGSSCGVASTIMASTTTAFCLTAQNCATGYYTFAHEMGHLQGARHDPDTDNSNNPFVYGHGYIIEPSLYRSIMAYNQDGETRVNQWSNPDVDFNRYPTGEPTRSDNARVLDETAETVASWCDDGNCD